MHKLLMRMDLRPRLQVYFLILSVIPVLFVGVLAYGVSARVIMNTTREKTVATTDMVCAAIDELFFEMQTLCQNTAEDIAMQRLMRREFADIKEQYSADLEGSMELAFSVASRDNLFGLYVIGENGGKYKSNAASFKVENVLERPWYRQIFESDQPVWFPVHQYSYAVKTIDDSYLSVGVPFVDKASGDVCGIVMADIEVKQLETIMERGLAGQGNIYLLDADGHIMYRLTFSGGSAPQDKAIESAVAQAQLVSGEPALLPDPDFLMVCRPLAQSGFKILGAIPKKEITRSTDSVAVAVSISLLLMIGASIFGGMVVSDTVTRPLRNLEKIMAQVESGDLSERVNSTYHDEIGRISNSFDAMLDETQRLIDQVVNEQKKLRQSELKVLQAQITPHFLYNSLDSVRWLLRLGKMEQAQQMLEALSTLFMVALSRGKEVITIHDEIRHVHSYLIIESMIYSKKIQYGIEVEPEIEQYKTLKLLLQPLVENAIYHGIKPKDGAGEILVCVVEEGKEITLTVRDTGVGMSEETVRRMQQDLDAFNRPRTGQKGYGLFNVNERVKLFYGFDYGVRVRSRLGEWTEVSIRIPKVTGEDFYV